MDKTKNLQEVNRMIQEENKVSKLDLISAIQAAQLTLLSGAWCKGTLFTYSFDGKGGSSVAHCMLGSFFAAGVPAPIPVAANIKCIKMTGGEALSYVNDEKCNTKEDALKFMDDLITYIEKEHE